MKWGQRSVSRYCLLPSWQQKCYDHKNTGMAIAPLAPQKQNLPLAFSVLTNTESSISFLESVLTSENTVSFISLLSLKKALANKVVCRKHFNSPSLLLFPCSESSRQKVFWKIGVSNFFVEILERHQGRISFVYIVASWRVTFLLQRLLKSQVVTNGFKLIPSWQLCRVAILKKKPFFSSTTSVAASVGYIVD